MFQGYVTATKPERMAHLPKRLEVGLEMAEAFGQEKPQDLLRTIARRMRPQTHVFGHRPK